MCTGHVRVQDVGCGTSSSCIKDSMAGWGQFVDSFPFGQSINPLSLCAGLSVCVRFYEVWSVLNLWKWTGNRDR